MRLLLLVFVVLALLLAPQADAKRRKHRKHIA